jgi:hypothetical protein
MIIGVHTTAHRRYAISKIAFAALRRTLTELEALGHQTFVVCGVSHPKSASIAKSFGFDTVMTPNSPVGRKFDVVMHKVLEQKCDYVMEYCSDNVLDTDYSNLAHQAMEDGIPYWGLTSFYILNHKTKQCRLFKGSLSNVGRLTRRYLLDNIKRRKNYFYEHRLQRGLDASFNKIMWEVNKTRADYPRLERPYIVDIKNEISMNPYANFSQKNSLFPIVSLSGNFPELQQNENE